MLGKALARDVAAEAFVATGGPPDDLAGAEPGRRVAGWRDQDRPHPLASVSSAEIEEVVSGRRAPAREHRELVVAVAVQVDRRVGLAHGAALDRVPGVVGQSVAGDVDGDDVRIRTLERTAPGLRQRRARPRRAIGPVPEEVGVPQRPDVA